MYVTHGDIKGELISSMDRIVFFPMDEPYGVNRLSVFKPTIQISGPDDDDCIVVTGLLPLGNTDEYRYTYLHFFPIPRPTPVV